MTMPQSPLAELDRFVELEALRDRRELDPNQAIRCEANLEIRADTINSAERSVEFVVSTPTLDRHGEIIEVEAFTQHMEEFMLNPVMLWMHDMWSPIGRWSDVRIDKSNGQPALLARAHFADTDLALEIWKLVSGGFVKAASVGFYPVQYEMQERDINGEKRRVRVHQVVKLIEISIVSIGSNIPSLVRAAMQQLKKTASQENSIDIKALASEIVDCLKTNLIEDEGFCERLAEELSLLMGHTKVVANGADLPPEDEDDSEFESKSTPEPESLAELLGIKE